MKYKNTLNNFFIEYENTNCASGWNPIINIINIIKAGTMEDNLGKVFCGLLLNWWIVYSTVILWKDNKKLAIIKFLWTLSLSKSTQDNCSGRLDLSIKHLHNYFFFKCNACTPKQKKIHTTTHLEETAWWSDLNGFHQMEPRIDV